MRGEQWISDSLNELRSADLQRTLVAYPQAGGRIRIDGRDYLNFSSNDYLDLSRNPELISRSTDELHSLGTSATASRLMAGSLDVHGELESRLSEWKGYECALLFGSGYLANIGLITSLVGREDSLFVDKLAHASIIDGARLSRASVHRFRHNDASHLKQSLERAAGRGRQLIVTESVFSMDGDIAPLKDLTTVAADHGALIMIDEAHASGVFGPNGAGLIKELCLADTVNLSMATLGKALAGYGGLVACSKAMRDLIVNRARPFIFTTALPPAAIGSAMAALDVLLRTPSLGRDLLENAAFFRSALHQAGLDTGPSQSQIVPIMLHDNRLALDLAAALREQGIIANAIREPAVPSGTARLRLSVTLAHTKEDLATTADVIAGTVGKLRS